MKSETVLDEVRSVLVVVVRPGDESFGLDAVLDDLTAAWVPVGLLRFTRGELTTPCGRRLDLAEVRAEALAAAAAVLGASRTELLDYPDGALADVALDRLVGHVGSLAAEVWSSHLLAFDPGDVTGHPDHVHARTAQHRVRHGVRWFGPRRGGPGAAGVSGAAACGDHMPSHPVHRQSSAVPAPGVAVDVEYLRVLQAR